MLHPIRARLAGWYAGVFALFLALCGAASYGFLSYTSRERIDEFLAETAAAVAGAMEFERKNGADPEQAIDNVLREFRLRETQIAVFDRQANAMRDAHLLLDSGTTAQRVNVAPLLQDPGPLLSAAGSVPSVSTHRQDRQLIRLYLLPYTLGARPLVIGAAQSMRAQQRMLREAEIVLAVGIPVMIALASIGGYILARQGLHPVVAMSERAEAIGAANLHERLPVRNARDELGRLATVFNLLLARIESSFEQQRRFMSDASHELRTPVAIISGESELALSRTDRDTRELRASLAAIKDESARLRGIVDDLFWLAQSNAGEPAFRPEELYLRDVVEVCLRGARTLASVKGVSLKADLCDDDLALRGDEALLKRVVMNLLDNAIKYTPTGGRVTLSTSREELMAVVLVSDTGPGVSVEDRERIFDRFYRSPSMVARGSRPSGAGLGLAIARWVARAHGGDVTLASAEPTGSVFRLQVPLPLASTDKNRVVSGRAHDPV
ncbi:MAG: Adaptive-response sensory-kinase SasA [Gemmatimonadaceae bacterium]|nr:Adaptive-response sensory-kinase SasA [Gemmatimonadaceae bacterium]